MKTRTTTSVAMVNKNLQHHEAQFRANIPYYLTTARLKGLYLIFLCLLTLTSTQAWASEIVALQGLHGNTLVAGKTTAFSMYSDPQTLAHVASVSAVIVRPDGSEFSERKPATESPLRACLFRGDCYCSWYRRMIRCQSELAA
jgi:hypothetical protein